MKITYEFDYYEDKDLRHEFEQGLDSLSAIFDIKNYLRNLRKHDDREFIPKEEIIEKIFGMLDGLADR